MATQPVKGVFRQVKPLISKDAQEAKRRVISLYKAFYKTIPDMILLYNLPLTFAEVRQKLRNDFLKNKDVTDIRVIDMLVIKGQLDFQEIHSKVRQRCQLMYMVKDTAIPPPKDFLSKFINGTD